MKKVLLASLLALSLTSTVALADDDDYYYYQNPNVPTGGFKGGRMGQTMTVKQALSAPDNSMITLVGSIAQQIGNDDYLFTDGTGQIKVEIKPRVWAGLNVGPQDKIRIYGKLDNEFLEFERAELDVISVQKVR